jgi:rSAM/selenodomain-associated transferase 2
MPVLNEAGALRETLKALGLTHGEELIVVDGGSADNTVSIAREFTDAVLETRRGRGLQMHLGAERAGGGILLFLHADCLLPWEAFDAVRAALNRPGVSAGAFDLGIRHPSVCFRVVERGANLRSRLTGVPYGDQGLFMRAGTYRRVGGFRDMPLMEDIEIAGRLRKAGRVVFLRPPIMASPRRWLKEGVVRATLRDWRLALSYALLKVSPERLARHYRDVR